MTLRLHWSPDSANLPVRVMLMLHGLDFEPVRVDRTRNAQRDPAYLALNPQGLIPVLEDGDTVLFETGAILWHLAERTGRLGPEGPAADDPAERAKALRWLFWVSNTVHADLRVAFYPQRWGLGDVRGTVTAGIGRRFADHLALADAAVGDGSWAGGARLTLVDAYLAACLRWASLYPSDGGPVIAADAVPAGLRSRIEALEALPGTLAAAAAEHLPGPHPFTRPGPPDLPPDEVLGRR